MKLIDGNTSDRIPLKYYLAMHIRIQNASDITNGLMSDVDCINQALSFINTCNEHAKELAAAEAEAKKAEYEALALYVKSLGGSVKKSHGMVKVTYNEITYSYATPTEAFEAIKKKVADCQVKEREEQYLAELIKLFPYSYIDPTDGYVRILSVPADAVDVNADDYNGQEWYVSAEKAAEKYGITLTN